LHVIDELSLNSGVSSVVMNYYKYIDKDKIIFDFLVHKPATREYSEVLERCGSKIFTMPALKSKNLFYYIKALNKFFKTYQEYKIIHGHLPNAAAFYLGTAKRNGIPVRIIHSHNACSADSLIKKIRNNLLNSFIPFVANKYVACSDTAASFLFRNKADKAFILYNAVETDKFGYCAQIRQKVRKELGLKDNQYLIGHVGRFCNQKNHSFLIDIFHELHRNYAPFRNSKLLLIGDGELYDSIQKKVRQLNLSDYVIFAGVTDRVSEYLQAMDLFVLPSYFEGLPVSAVEAQVSGLPCFISDTVTTQTSISDRTFFLSLKDDPGVWAEKISTYSDTGERKPVYDSKFDIRVQAKELERFYMDIYDQIREN